jgi:hypothetical protein
MLSTIRRAKLHAPYTAAKSAQFATGATVIDSGIAIMYAVNGVLTTFHYDSTNKTVVAIFNGTSRTRLHGVENFKVTLEPMRSTNSVKTGGSWDLLKRASILVTLKTSTQTALSPETHNSLELTLSCSIMPRRNAW